MNENFPNIITKNVLTDEERSEIFQITAETKNQTFNPSLGHNSWHIQLPEHIIDKFTKHACAISGEELFLREYNVSRYEKVTSDAGNTYSPLLFPHTDETFKEPRFTLDYQLRSNLDWALIVDDWENVNIFVLKDNEMLSFSGTHQVHWRHKKDFKDGDFVEMLFMHFGYKNYQDPLTEDHLNKIRDRVDHHKNVWEQQPGPSKNPIARKV